VIAGVVVIEVTAIHVAEVVTVTTVRGTQNKDKTAYNPYKKNA